MCEYTTASVPCDIASQLAYLQVRAPPGTLLPLGMAVTVEVRQSGAVIHKYAAIEAEVDATYSHVADVTPRFMSWFGPPVPLLLPGGVHLRACLTGVPRGVPLRLVALLTPVHGETPLSAPLKF